MWAALIIAALVLLYFVLLMPGMKDIRLHD
jgi:hypothetical protein